MGVSMKYQGCFMQVSWIGSFKGVSRKFQEAFKGVLREFQAHFKEVLRMIQGSFRAVQIKFPWCFKEFQGCCKKFLVWKCKVCVESISRVFKENFESVSGVF